MNKVLKADSIKADLDEAGLGRASSGEDGTAKPASALHKRGRNEQGQVITTLILTVPVLLLIFLVFFTLTTSQSASVAQVAADAAVIHLQELDALKSLPPDDPNTVKDERKEAFLELALSGVLIEQGRAEVYARMCSSSRWIVGDACQDWGTNIPTEAVTRIATDDPDGDDCTPPPNPDGRPLEDRQVSWPDVKVWISFPDLPVPAAVLDDDGDPVIACLSNPLDSVEPGSELWQKMMEHPIERWRVVVLVRLRPVVPALMTFIVRQPDRMAISCGPLFLAGSDPELWKC